MDKDCSSKIEFNNCINVCKSLLENLRNDIFGDECSSWFKNVCEALANVLVSLETKLICYDNDIQKMLLLHIFQFASALSLLVEVFKYESIERCVLSEGRKLAMKQLFWCLDGLKVCNENVLNNCGSFIVWMDKALDGVSAIDIQKGSEVAINTCETAKQHIEEVLSYAMSIAQVAIASDKDSIKGGCKTVLEELGTLSQQCSKPEPNLAMCNLFVDYVTSKLYTLEERVNNSVLRLCLHVFSNCSEPLNALVAFCDSFDFTVDSNNAQFDDLVASFDLHVDRIMQIGFFAIACSTDYNLVIKMQSCLASLEALEGELVPSLSAYSLENSSINKSLALALQNHWIKEVIELRRLIYLILDAAAFCNIVYEEISNMVENLQSKVRSNIEIKSGDFVTMTNQANVLVEMVETYLKDDANFFNSSAAQDTCNVLRNLTNEVKIASELLLASNYEKGDGPARVMKRCLILIKKVTQLRADLTVEKAEISDNEGLDVGEATNTCKFAELKLLSNHRQNVLETLIKRTEKLDSLEIRGQKILNDRSVLYRTPHKTIHSSFSTKTNLKKIIGYNNYSKISHSVPKKLRFHKNSNFSRFSRSGHQNSTMNLQITDIFENISNLSNTFSLATRI